MKEIKKIDIYLDLARELKKLSNMKVTVISAVVGDFRLILKSLKEKKSLERGIRYQRKKQKHLDHSIVKNN